MSQAKRVEGFLGLVPPPRTASTPRTRPRPVMMADLSPEEWRIIALAECPKVRRTMAELTREQSVDPRKSPPCRSR